LATLEKIYACLQCGTDIKLEKREAGGWNKYDASTGKPHVHAITGKKPQQQQQQYTVESKIDALIAEIQALRKELQAKK
jgi:hypothetical protein